MRKSTSLLSILLATSSILGTACVTDDEDGADGDHTTGFEDAFQQLADGKADSTGCSGVVIPDRGDFHKKVILTFDDGPNPATTPKVIATLHRHHAPATFFINGMRVNSQASKDLLQQEVNDPDFMVGNHSQHHYNLGVYTADGVEKEYAPTDAIIRATGEVPKFFRFPYGSANCAGAQVVRDHGMTIVGWHIDSADWCFAATGGATCKKATFQYVPDNMRNDMKGYILSQIRANHGGVMLMHDIHQSSADALDGIMTQLESEGYTFARLDDASVLPRLNGVAPTATKFIGDVCTTDAQCNFQVGSETGHCAAAGFCTVSCNGSCPDSAGKAPTFCIANGTADAGICASKAAAQNAQCASLPGTVKSLRDRYLGTSTSAPATATVCAPPQ